MTDLDNYFYKCFMEKISADKKPEEIHEECSCKYGYKNLNHDSV